MSSPPISTASDLEQLFLAALPTIDRIVAVQARRHGLSAADADDFGAWAKARLVERDYAVLRKFGGRSSLQTYLASVLANLFRDYRNSRWGRWRPSAAAKRLGPTAIRLEELLYRDGRSLREAVEILRTAGETLHESELAQLVARIPQRARAGELNLDAVPGSDANLVFHPDGLVDRDEEALRAVEDALRALVEELPAEDALILRMRFWHGTSVADIARTLGLDQKGLYRRIEAIQARLRTALEARGVNRALASEILNP